jgi:hypothetical protein
MIDCQFAQNRRAFLGSTGGLVGSLALADLLHADGPPAHRVSDPKAKAVICLFQHGGPSQVDLFDPKPELTRRDGQPYPGDIEVHFEKKKGNLLASPYSFRRRGESGIKLSELLPHTGAMADELTVVRSMMTSSVDHESALRLIHGGKFQAGRPTLGSWVIYALGAENRDLPAYVVLTDPGGMPIDGVKNWSSGWLPASYQGTPFRSGGSPVLNLETPGDVTPAARRRQLRLLDELNRDHLAAYPGDTELQARIANFEIAARMQSAVPEAIDLSRESAATKRMYGLENKATREYGTRCLIARRLVERGVRFVQLFLAGQPWDTHDKNAAKTKELCGRIDQPSAALVRDLAQRGLLDSTIVLWTGEFGRLPISQDKDGRDHNRRAFSLWLAGGGFRRGYVHGRTDDFGYESVENIVTVHDLHATLLAALGLDHRRLTYPHDGREDSLTDSEVTKARVVKELFA